MANRWRAAGARAWDGARLVSGADRRLVVLDSVLRAHPYLAEAHRARALAWRDLALGGSALAEPRLSRAEASLRSALRLRPSWGEAWADRAWLRYLQRDAAGARADLARSQELDPTNVPLARSRANLGALLDRSTPTP